MTSIRPHTRLSAAGTLVIDTAHFAEHRRGNSVGGLASSREKHLMERLRLGDDKTYLSYTFRLEDPEYLAEPVTGTLAEVAGQRRGSPADTEGMRYPFSAD